MRNYGENKYVRFGKLRGPYLFTSYQFAKFKDQINIGPDKHHNLGMDKVTHYAYCDFPGYSKCGKNIL